MPWTIGCNVYKTTRRDLVEATMKLRDTLKQFMAFPAFAHDEEKERLSALLSMVINATMIGLPFIIVGNLLGGNVPGLVSVFYGVLLGVAF